MHPIISGCMQRIKARCGYQWGAPRPAWPQVGTHQRATSSEDFMQFWKQQECVMTFYTLILFTLLSLRHARTGLQHVQVYSTYKSTVYTIQSQLLALFKQQLRSLHDVGYISKNAAKPVPGKEHPGLHPCGPANCSCMTDTCSSTAWLFTQDY